MATKLKNLKITKVDFVDDGANPEAHVRLYKSKDGEEQKEEQEKGPNLWKRIAKAIAKAVGATDEDIDSALEEIAKGGSENFKEKFNAIKNRKVTDEIWDICYALQSSLCSILNDEDMDSTSAATAMNESLTEFNGVMKTAIEQWSNGEAASIVRKETAVTESELELMKTAKARLEESIEKSVVVPAQSGPENNNSLDAKGATDMSQIDKSKLTESERVFLESIEKRYGVEETPAPEVKGTPAVATPDVPAQDGVAKAAPATQAQVETPAQPTATEGEDIYKGMHPAVKAELEALRKAREDAEDKEVHEVAKRYEIIGKKEDELFPVLKNLKAAGGTAYNDMIAILDQTVETVEKSTFGEIGKSGSAGTTNGASWAKADAQAVELMKSKTGITKAQALDEVFKNDPELAKECEKED